jgi:hypothetical protein
MTGPLYPIQPGSKFSFESSVSVQVKPNLGFEFLNLNSSLGLQSNDSLITLSNFDTNLSNLVISSNQSVSGISFHQANNFLIKLLEVSDPILLLAELGILLFLLSLTSKLASSSGITQAYGDIVSLCQTKSISLAEIFTLTTLSLGFIIFDAFVTLSEDDILEGVSYLFLSIIALAVFLLFVAIDLQYYYLVSAISGGELTIRIIYNDVLNNGLCLLRIFFCWVRYLFYDLQSELVDLSFHYTELSENDSIAWVGFSAYLDTVSMVFQLLIGAFKLALALFLF